VSTFKRTLLKKLGIEDKWFLHLAKEGKLLDECSTLMDYSVLPGSTLHLLVRVVGGNSFRAKLCKVSNPEPDKLTEQEEIRRKGYNKRTRSYREELTVADRQDFNKLKSVYDPWREWYGRTSDARKRKASQSPVSAQERRRSPRNHNPPASSSAINASQVFSPTDEESERILFQPEDALDELQLPFSSVSVEFMMSCDFVEAGSIQVSTDPKTIDDMFTAVLGNSDCEALLSTTGWSNKDLGEQFLTRLHDAVSDSARVDTYSGYIWENRFLVTHQRKGLALLTL
jgi:hypothetical protein